jgi:hypothetical protein
MPRNMMVLGFHPVSAQMTLSVRPAIYAYLAIATALPYAEPGYENPSFVPAVHQ